MHPHTLHAAQPPQHRTHMRVCACKHTHTHTHNTHSPPRAFARACVPFAHLLPWHQLLISLCFFLRLACKIDKSFVVVVICRGVSRATPIVTPALNVAPTLGTLVVHSVVMNHGVARVRSQRFRSATETVPNSANKQQHAYNHSNHHAAARTAAAPVRAGRRADGRR